MPASTTDEVAESPRADSSSETPQLDSLLETVALPGHAPAPDHAPTALPTLFTARLVAIDHARRAHLRRSAREPELVAAVAADVGQKLLEWALAERQRVLVEALDGGPTVVGVVQTRTPTDLKLQARRVELDATQELVLRSGHAGMKLRADGQVELVGSRISAASRGLFRLVGRILRLN